MKCLLQALCEVPMWGYKKRLTRDVSRWREAGWLTAEAESRIVEELARSGREVGLASALGILASILLSFAVVSFVAAHWQEMPRGARLALIFALISAGYAAAGYLASRGAAKMADAGILFSCAVFGAGIALISQMYHIDGHPPDGVLLWGLGSFLAGAALRSNPALALSLVLFALWTAMEMGGSGRVHWPFLGAWAAVSAAFAWQRWQPGVHLSGLAMTMFVIGLGYVINKGHAHHVVVGIGLLVAALSIAAMKSRPEWDGVAAPALGYAIAAAYVGMFALQFFEDISTSRLILLAAITLLGLLATIAFGLYSGHRGALWLGYIGFSIEILSVYWKTVGTLLDTSLFFLVAGLIVAALAYMAYRLAQRGGMERGIA
jgi:uncharacterized membrane protein